MLLDRRPGMEGRQAVAQEGTAGIAPVSTGASDKHGERLDAAGADARAWIGRLMSAEALAALSPTAGGVPAELWRRALGAPVAEILSRPGKGFRGRLTELAYRMGGGRGQPPAALAAMLEVIHAGSMIVDDIEDGSNERRGAPAVHTLFGVPVALNAGNWMYFAPLELVGALGLAPQAELRLYRRTTRVLLDCHYGQALDLASRVGAVPREALGDVAATISTLKTGRLLSLAAEAGAMAAGATAERVQAIAAFGEALGVGLQMLDDLGNLSGKTAPEKRYEDLRNGRVTWVWAWAAAQLDEQPLANLVALCERLAGEPAARFEPLAVTLRGLVVGQGRAQAHWYLREALARLRAQLGVREGGFEGACIDGIEREIARLEVSYG